MPKPPKSEKPQPEIKVLGKKTPKLTEDKEIGGQKGPEPTRYGDWENNGRCTDF